MIAARTEPPLLDVESPEISTKYHTFSKDVIDSVNDHVPDVICDQNSSTHCAQHKTRADNDTADAAGSEAQEVGLTSCEKVPADASQDQRTADGGEVRVYRRRWVILALFSLLSMLNGFQFAQYATVSNAVMKYYGVGSQAVSWTAVVYMVSYILLALPAFWVLRRAGLRISTILGAFGTAAGAWIKVASISPDRFAVTFVGQTLAAVSQVLIVSVPPRLAAVWFGPDQVSTACSVGTLSNQIGSAFGLIVPPLIVRNHKNIADIGSDLSVMFYGVAGCTTPVLILIALFFQEAPPLPPSMAQAQRGADSIQLFRSIKTLMTNSGFCLLFVTYGIFVGLYNALAAILSQIISYHFPGEEEDTEIVGVTIVVAGVFGAVVCGYIMDRTHKFKETALAVYVCTTLSFVVWAVTLRIGHVAWMYVVSGFMGLFLTLFLPLGFELAVELTYPEPEVTSSGLLLLSVQIFAVFFTLSYTWMLEKVSDILPDATLACALLLGTIMTACIRPDLHRQAAAHAVNPPTVGPEEGPVLHDVTQEI